MPLIGSQYYSRKKAKSAPSRGALLDVVVPISRVLWHYGAISRRITLTTIYLGYALPHTSSGTPAGVLPPAGTALHRSKDLAVAPATLPKRLIPPQTCVYGRMPCFFKLPRFRATGVSVRTSRLAPDGRYPLPFCGTVPLARLRTPMLGLSSMTENFRLPPRRLSGTARVL